MSNRLPTHISPVKYEVSLKPDLTKLTFQGWETITVKVTSATDKISLNAYDITFLKVSLKDLDGSEKVPETAYDVKTEIATFTFAENLKPGDYELSIDFTGNLNEQMRGFYRNKYFTPDGHTRYAGVTHFEATGARRAYPCWDEPCFKSVFHFTLIAPKDRVAVCNMPVKEEKTSKEDSNLKVVSFEPTPKMSTYLTAFAVGEYDFLEATTVNGTKVRVYTPLGKAEHGRFALEFATKALPFYEDYFKVPYGLPKIDLITLTEFPIGAMENWGLVTYRETALLIDPDQSSASARQYVALIVAHELSHNWFGNYVTMSWWSDLWLKEGFATWIEYLCVHALMPELRIWSRFVQADQNQALEMDALSNSHPIQVTVENPGQIDEIFDSISYNKGASLIRMLESYMGSEQFRLGMQRYLNQFMYSNTVTSDLWKCMGEVKGQDIKQLMDSWTQQMGFPLIRVKEEQVDDNTRKVTLTQEKFCSSQKAAKDPSNKKYHWRVPFSILTSQSPSVAALTDVMVGDSVTVTLDNCKPDDWIKVNANQSMFYHVMYSPESMSRLLPAIKQQLISAEDRIGLLTDLFALCKADYMKIPKALEVTKSFRQDTDFAVCDKLGIVLGSLCSYMECVAVAEGVEDGYPKFVCDSLREMGERMGWDAKEGEEDTSLMTREKLLTYLGVCGEAKVKEEAFRRFHSHVKGEKLLSNDIKSPVYATVLCHGDNDVFDSVLKIYRDQSSEEDTSRIQRSLGLMTHRMEDVLKFAISDEVRLQDSIHVMVGVTHCIKGRALLSQFVMDQWEELYRRYSTSTMLNRLVQAVTRRICSQEWGTKLKEFFAKHETKSASSAVRQGLENISANAALVQSQSKDIAAFLKAYQSTA